MDLLIKNGNLYNLKDGKFYLKDILINGNKIVKVGKIKDSVNTIDAKRKYIFPGFIDAHSHIGMWEDIEYGNDANECVDPVTPNIKAIDAFNPYDPFIKSACKAGFSTIMITPGSGNVVCGQASIIKTNIKSNKLQLIRKSAALKVALGENPKSVYKPRFKSPSSRMGTAYILKNYLEESLKSIKAGKYDNDKYNIMEKVLNKEIPIKIHCHRADDILTAIRIMNDYDFNYTIDHCTEGYMVKDTLMKVDVPLLLGPLFMFESKSELKNSDYKNVFLLNDISSKVSLISDHPFSNSSYMTKILGYLVSKGLNYLDAIKMITLNPAKAIGLENEIGDIDVGYTADLNIFSSDPLNYKSDLLLSVVNGEIEYMCKEMVIQNVD